MSQFQVSCKFFYYNTETKSWVERGMGFLRVNQKKGEREQQIRIREFFFDLFVDKQQYFLVGRTTGNQKVVINSKLFTGMIFENLSDKRLKISVQNPETELPQLFIIQVESIEQIMNFFVCL